MNSAQRAREPWQSTMCSRNSLFGFCAAMRVRKRSSSASFSNAMPPDIAVIGVVLERDAAGHRRDLDLVEVAPHRATVALQDVAEVREVLLAAVVVPDVGVARAELQQHLFAAPTV